MNDPKYTPKVLKLVKDIRELSIGEMIALRDALANDFDILPPDIGVREPINPKPKPPYKGADVDWDERNPSAWD